MLKVSLPNNLAALTKLGEHLDEVTNRFALNEQASYGLHFVLEELFVNFVTYGATVDGEMRITVDLRKSFLQIHIEDDGKPFNPIEAQSPDVDAVLDERAVGGLGLHLVRQYCEQISYERVQNMNTMELRLKTL